MRCFGPFFHKWTKWEFVERIRYFSWEGLTADYSSQYERHCIECGRPQRKEF